MRILKLFTLLILNLIFKTCATLLMVLLIVGLLLFFSEAFRLSALAHVAKLSPITIEIQTATSPSLAEWSAKQIRIVHSTDKIISIDDPYLKWDPTALYSKELKVSHLKSSAIEILIPADHQEKHTGANKLIEAKNGVKKNIFDYIPVISIDNIFIGALRINDLQPLSITGSATHSFETNATKIPSLQVKVGGSSNRLSANFSKQKLELSIDLKQLPLEIFEFKYPNIGKGVMDVTLRFSLSSGEIHTLGEVHVIHQNNERQGANKADISWNTQTSIIMAKAMFENAIGIEQAIEISIAKKPYEDYLKQTFFLNKKQLSSPPLAITLKAITDLESLGPAITLTDHSFKGQLQTRISFSGSVANPRIFGSIDILNGQYRHLSSGFLLRDFDCQINANEDQLSLSKCRATDDLSGSYSFTGKIHYGSGKADGNILISMTNVSPTRLKFVDSQVSGDLLLKIVANQLTVKSEIELKQFLVDLDAISYSNIPSIKTREKTRNNTNDKSVLGNILPSTQLDLKIQAANKAYLKGRGLNAELSGKLKVTGSLNAPVIRSEFNIIRGEFVFFNKIFKLKRGNFILADETILFEAKGQYQGNGREILVSLVGSNDEIEISFSSIPEMPEDEILSWLLFGKSLHAMPPLEAYRFGTAIKTLKGEKPLLDPLERSRALLGADQLTIEGGSDSQEPLTLGVGKYLSEAVYLKMKRTASDIDPWQASIEVELSQDLNLESSINDTTGAGGIELNWQQDY